MIEGELRDKVAVLLAKHGNDRGRTLDKLMQLLENGRWCDRSIRDVRYSAKPNGQSNPFLLFGTHVANPIWQWSCATATTDRKYDRKRSDLLLPQLLQAGRRIVKGKTAAPRSDFWLGYSHRQNQAW